MPTRQEHAKVKQDMPHMLKGFGTNQTCSCQVMQQKKLSCFSLYGQTPHGTNWANTTGEFYFSKRESVTQWVSCMQNEFARSPFGARHSLSGSRSPCYGKNHSLQAGNVVHPQAIYRELCYSYSSGRGCDRSPKAGKGCPQRSSPDSTAS